MQNISCTMKTSKIKFLVNILVENLKKKYLKLISKIIAITKDAKDIILPILAISFNLFK